MSFSDMQLIKKCHHNYFMTLQIRKNNKNMSFSDMQLTKNMSSQLFHDITNPQK